MHGQRVSKSAMRASCSRHSSVARLLMECHLYWTLAVHEYSGANMDMQLTLK